MRILLVAVLLASCADDGVRHTPDSTLPDDAAIDAPADAPLAPAMLSGSPGDTAFGDVVLGQATAKVTYTISNDGEQASGTIGVLVDSTTAGFSISDNHCSGVSLAPDETCTFAVYFQPSVAGLAMTTVHAGASPGGDVARGLTGTGLQPGAIDITEASHDYLLLAVDAAQPRTHTFTVKNTGQVPTGVPAPSITGTQNAYSVASTTCTAALAPQGTCAVVVHFDPATVGSKPGSLVVTASPGGSDSATLAGTGFAHVAVTKTGSGGTVTSSVTGIDCGSSCAADFTTTPVSLTAVPATGSMFAGWTGDCSGMVACSLDLTAGKSVTAAFDPQRFMLTTMTAGNGSGTVTGAGTYDYNTPVTVTATAASSSTFTGFSGACTDMGPCTVTMTQDRSVTASFALKRFTLTTATTGTGSGTVTGAGTYDYNTPVTVTASPAIDSTFTGFSGACIGMGPCTVTMTQARSVTANFDLIPETLTVTSGTGGTITSSPAGISCAGATCSKDFGYGTPVTLTAIPDVGQQLALWAGACSGVPVTSPTCTVTMDQAQSVTVRWSPRQFRLSLTFPGDSPGTVTVNGVQYTTDASIPVSYGQTLTLTASSSYNFYGWGGACSGNAGCTVNVTGDTSVSATFVMGRYQYTVIATTQTPNGIYFDVTYPVSLSGTNECQSSTTGTSCSVVLPSTLLITLTAHLPTGLSFGVVWNDLPSWSGCDNVSSDKLTCTFRLLSDRTIGVKADARPAP